jgi:hypothetical protein
MNNQKKPTKRVAKPVSRLAKKRLVIEANRNAARALKGLVSTITVEFSLDEDRMAKRIDSAGRSEYGTINGLVNLVAAIANWPVEQGDGSMVSTNRQLLETKFNLDLMLLEDIRTYRGFHTFATDDLEILPGVEPRYDDYTDYCEIFLEELGVVSSRPTIDSNKWTRAEVKAKERAHIDIEIMKSELELHKQFLAQQEAS